MSEPRVVDASVVVAVIKNERGAERFAELLDDAVISAVNLSEVVAKMQDERLPDSLMDAVLAELGLGVLAFDAATAVAAGKLRMATRSKGLSLGDRACLATAVSTAATAVTLDRAWAELDLGVAVEIAR